MEIQKLKPKQVFTIGAFEPIRASRGSTASDKDLYIFHASEFEPMKERLEDRASPTVRLMYNTELDFAQFHGRYVPHNPLIHCYGSEDKKKKVIDLNHNSSHFATKIVYHVKDCTLLHFLDEPYSYIVNQLNSSVVFCWLTISGATKSHRKTLLVCYIVVINNEPKKRDEALDVLREVFA